MSRRRILNSALIFTVLILGSLTVTNYAANLLGILPSTSAQDASLPLVGIDCGLGSTSGSPNGAPPTLGTPPVIGDTILDQDCSWAGDADAVFSPSDTTQEPLVSDAPSTFPSYGGGFTAEVRVTNFPGSSGAVQINGADCTIVFDTKILNAVSFDQAGLFFDPDNPPPGGTGTTSILVLRSELNNLSPNGIARLALTVLGTPSTPLATDATLMRVRFDVVGVGTSTLALTCFLTQPSAILHKDQSATFESASFFDPGNTLGWRVTWTSAPIPAVPLQELNFTVLQAICPLCTGQLSYSWDTNSDGVEDANGLEVSLPGPPPPIINRVTLTVTDGAANFVKAVRRLPLALALSGGGTVAVGSPVSFTATWIGGIPPYTASWRFCPGNTIGQKLVCNFPNPQATGAATASQTNTQSVTYNFAGVYNNSLTLTDTASGGQPQSLESATVLVTVTGAPQAYVVTVVPDDANPDINQLVTFTASIAYNNNYPAYSKSADTIVNGTAPAPGTALKTSTLLKFCDTATVGGPCVTTGNRLWDPTEWVFSASTATITGASVALYAGSGARPTTGTLTSEIPSHFRYVDPNGNSVFDQGEPVVYDVTTNGVFDANFKYLFDFGDSTSQTVTGGFTATATHTYSTPAPFTVKAVATENGGAGSTGAAISKIKETGSADIIVKGLPVLTVSVSCGAATAGKPFTCTAVPSNGTPPFTFEWTVDGTIQAGQTSNTFTTTFATKGSHTIAVSVRDNTAATASDSTSVTVAAQPLQVDFTISNNNPGIGVTITFTSTVSGGTAPYSYSWDFGDGTTGTGASPTHSYATSGTKTVILTVTDDNLVASSPVSHTVQVKPPLLTVTVSCGSATAGKPVTCTATPAGGTLPYSFAWKVDNVVQAGQTAATFTTTFANKGSHTIAVTVTDSTAPTPQTATDSASVTVAAQPLQADFTISNDNPGINVAVTFTSTVSGGAAPYSYSWDFGDGTTGTGASPTHSYTTSGTKTVTLTVTDFNNVVSSPVSHNVQVKVGLSVAVSCGPATAGKPVTCTAVPANGTPPFTFEWTVDGTVQAGQTSNTFTTTFATKGTHTIGASVRDNTAQTASDSASVTVAGQPLQVDFTISNNNPDIGVVVTFTSTVSGGTVPYSYSWDFGDGTTGTGASPTHSYATGGTKTVTLTVTDFNDVVSTPVSHTVQVKVPAVLVVTVSCGSATAGKPVTCTATTTNGTPPFTFEWTVDDVLQGETSNTLTTTFATKGSHTVAVTATDSSATPQTDTDQATVNVAGQPLQADFAISNDNPGVGVDVTFTATVSGGTEPYSYSWDFGDGTTGTGASPTHAYATSGTKTVTLTVTDFNNVVSSPVSHTVTVKGQFSLTVSCGTATAGKPVTCTAVPSSGTPPFTFEWTVDGAIQAGQTSNTFTTTFATKGSHTVGASATDSTVPTPLTATDSATVNVAGQPLQIDFTISNNNPDIGAGVTFIATVSGGTEPYTFAWDFGDGTTGSGASPSHQYATSGAKTVTLVVTDFNDVVSSPVSHTVQVKVPIVLVVTVSCGSATTGKPVTCTAATTNGTPPFTFEWTVDGVVQAETSNTLTTTLSTKGSHTVAVTVTDSSLPTPQTASNSASVNVAGQPLSVDFTISNNNPAIGETVTFDATASGGTTGYTFDWDFGDGSSATGASTSHSYSIKGTFHVTVTVTDANTATDSATHDVNVKGTPPTADFTFDPASPTVGKPVTFTSTVSGGTAPYSYSWNFGDGSTSTEASPQHSYTTKGSFTVTLEVTDANVATATASHSLIVSGQPLIVDFTSSPASPTTNSPVTFSATVTGGTAPYTYNWNFGDTSAGTSSPVDHTYTAAGTYTVTLTVDDQNGATQTATHTVDIASSVSSSTGAGPVNFLPSDGTMADPTPVDESTLPTAGKPAGVTFPFGFFSWTITGLTPGQTVTLTMTYPSNVASPAQYWKVIGTTWTDASSLLGDDDGDNVLTLTITDGGLGDADGAVNGQISDPGGVGVVTITQLTVDFAPVNTLVGDTNFVAIISGGTAPYSCSWNFADGSPTQTGCNVTHTYTTSGTFNVLLTVVDSATTSQATTHNVKVEPAPTFIRGKLSWRHHLTGGAGTTQHFVGKVSNPNSFSVQVTLTVNIFTDSGVFVDSVSSTKTMAPFTTDLSFTVDWTTTSTGRFMLTASISYQLNLGDLNVPPDGVSEIVTGTSGSKSGSFAVVP